MVQQSIAILLVFGLLAATLYLLRRKSTLQLPGRLARTASKERQMHVIERIPLTPQHSLHLVSVRNSVLLIGLSPSGCNKIAEFGPPLEPKL